MPVLLQPYVLDADFLPPNMQRYLISKKKETATRTTSILPPLSLLLLVLLLQFNVMNGSLWAGSQSTKRDDEKNIGVEAMDHSYHHGSTTNQLWDV